MITLKQIKPGGIAPEIRLLRLLEAMGDTGRIDGLTLSEMESDVQISHNTMKKYLREFRDAGILKFHLDGTFRLNPEVFDLTEKLSSGDIKLLKAQYEFFVSD